MKVYDCFTFFNELELLELRLKELNEVVDKFVIVEANLTHTGSSKEFILEQNKDMYSDYMDKIIHVKVEDLPDYNNYEGIWEPENFQRNCIMRGLTNAEEGDAIMVSDIDEIPKPSIIATATASSEKWKWLGFEQDLFYYYVNCKQAQLWRGPVMACLGDFPNPQALRDNRGSVPFIRNAGWHYSFMGGAERIITKVKNIAESSLIIDKIGGEKEIKEKMETQTDLWNREDDFAKKQIVPLDENSPKNIGWFIEKYPEFYYNEND